MGKKSEQAKRQAAAAVPAAAYVRAITALGKKIMGIGVVVIVLGFIALSRADDMGRNWAARLSSFLILGGYIIVGFGIFAPKKLPTSQEPAVPPYSPPDGLFAPERTI